MQLFLETECNLKVSVPTISRGLRKMYGTPRREGRSARIKSRKQRQAEGRTIAAELRQNEGPNGGSGDANDDAEDDDPADEEMDQQNNHGFYEEVQRLAPLQQAVSYQQPAHAAPASHVPLGTHSQQQQQVSPQDVYQGHHGEQGRFWKMVFQWSDAYRSNGKGMPEERICCIIESGRAASTKEC